MESNLISRLSVLSHPQRMAVFRLLMRRYPDRLPAGEIAQVLDTKPSTTSVYLGALTGAGLLSQQRVGTSLLYRVDMKTAQDVVSELFLDCCKGRPDLCPPSLISQSTNAEATPDNRRNVLFICTGNSARSIFAEAILNDVAVDRFNAFSAGTSPSSKINPNAIALLTQKGVDTSHLRPKNISEFKSEDGREMDFVFTVCDRAANEECPPWSGQPVCAHWGQPDPVKEEGAKVEQKLAFQRAYGLLRNRITAFTTLPLESLDRVSLQRHIDEIGTMRETK
ncbi:MAG: helix-turn-helix domain-containing protein [Pseudomonadota bacterium]